VPVALTQEQIEEHNPPPNPAKITDPRAGDYIAVHGNTSWEVDALPPQVLHKLIEEAILERIDEDLYTGQLDREEEDKKALEVYAGIDKKNLLNLHETLKSLKENAEDADADVGIIAAQAEAALTFFNVSFEDLLE